MSVWLGNDLCDRCGEIHAVGYDLCRKPPVEPVVSRRAYYLTVAEHFNLNDACCVVYDALKEIGYGIYLVGSCLTRADYRDVDLRCIMRDEEFARMFGASEARLKFLNVAVSEWLTKRTGLPVDFQFQGQTEANTNKGPRNAMGHRISA